VSGFFGKYDYSVDAKGRVNIPAKFRKALNPAAEETFVVVRAPGNCLRAYPKDAWDKYFAKISELSETPENLRLKRLLTGNMCESAFDGQGRIMLTPALMEIAHITKDVTLVGEGSYIELFDTASYNKEFVESAADFDDAFFAVQNRLAEA
jgi:MraZ protein